MTIWMIWASAVTLTMAVAAVAGERCLRLLGRPGRFAWIGALGGSAALMGWSVLRPVSAAPPTPSSGPVEGFTLDLVRELASAGSLPGAPLAERLDTVLAIAWAAGSALLLTALVVGLVRLALRARSWPTAVLGGHDVLISKDVGPALVGVWSQRIVLPRWALGLGAERLRMACLHEAEHRRMGDGVVLLVGVLAVAIAPWNAALWWILRRLRAAVEVDCDARVLRTGVRPSSYGAMLLDLGARPHGVPMAVAAFARPKATLERRLTMIVRASVERRRAGYTRAGVALVTALGLVTLACEMPAPTGLLPEEAAAEAVSPVLSQTAEPDEGAGGVLQRRGDGVLLEGALSPPRRIRLRETQRVSSDVRASPIIYIDGIRIESDADWGSDLAPADIERIEVVKAGAAVALYGEDAAGGVVQIFTKGGRK